MDDRNQEFVALFGDFVRSALHAESSKEPPFRGIVQTHLGVEPDLPVVAEDVPAWDHVNLQVAIEALTTRPGRTAELVGIAGGQKRFMPLSLSDLVNESHFRPGPVEYENLEVGPGGRTHPCILYGLVLLREGDTPAVMLVRKGEEHGPNRGIQVEVMSPDADRSGAILAELRELMHERNVFRGQMISLESTMWGQTKVVFHERPRLAREDVILPTDLLRDVERHTLGIGRHAAVLRGAGRHLKRGLLLHGPPGTGKTHTVKWLSGQLGDATVIVLSGGSLGAAGAVCRLARELAPSLVVLEDVDLVAEERTMMDGGGGLLFELLNELDGMADDADVAVVLTTNRPDLLEPALAARPGRVDLAVEIPLPDADCRRRLFDLYAQGLPLELQALDTIIERTDGVTASFFRELLRQAALEAADAESEVVRDEHVEVALERLLGRAGELTKILLGAARPDPSRMQMRPGYSWMVGQGTLE